MENVLYLIYVLSMSYQKHSDIVIISQRQKYDKLRDFDALSSIYILVLFKIITNTMYSLKMVTLIMNYSLIY